MSPEKRPGNRKKKTAPEEKKGEKRPSHIRWGKKKGRGSGHGFSGEGGRASSTTGRRGRGRGVLPFTTMGGGKGERLEGMTPLSRPDLGKILWRGKGREEGERSSSLNLGGKKKRKRGHHLATREGRSKGEGLPGEKKKGGGLNSLMKGRREERVEGNSPCNGRVPKKRLYY